ncbi:hypothetical protein KUTeg_015708 [Tegillarca granosa]|uniref:VWFA domain-containing protein n=1 Tax=Tegillarca granosa TaxID=220873 RepID=A0ABQ9EN25_TEGGR|nr:hypothetical protein KUTeg_015708 [Tegillarca granosa]
MLSVKHEHLKMLRIISAIIFISFFQLCLSFPPNAESAQGSKSHEIITRHGVYGAIAKYIKSKEYVTGIFETDYQCIKEYFNSGLKDVELADIASPSENTCKNSFSGQKHLGHCPNNILVFNNLTSGYKGGQDIEKPISSDNDHGKCSHGGPRDSTRTTTANCGINKETSDSLLSPHYHLHEHAAAAAIKATEHFIYGDEYSSKMIEALENLIVQGGGDCPEFALSGMAKAILLSRYQSNIYVFTDANPKDGERASEILRLATDKRIVISFLLTGTCWSRKRRSNGSSKRLNSFTKYENKLRYKRQSGFDSVFHTLANGTGGIVHDVRYGSLSEVLETVLQASFPNTSDGLILNQVNIDYISQPENSSSLMQFDVDKSVTELQIQITGAQSINHELIHGEWNIIPKVNNELNTNITGQSTYDFTYKITEEGDDGYLYAITGNPIAGKSYTVVIKLIGDAGQLFLSSLILIDSTGLALSTYPLVKLSTSDNTTYVANVTMQYVNVFFKIRGNDTDGNVLTRIKWSKIYPVHVLLTVVPVYEELLINKEYELNYMIKNLGDTTESFITIFTNNRGYTVSPSRNHTLEAEATIQDTFIMLPTASGTTFFTIEIRTSESNDTLQSITEYLFVTSVQHPTCNIVYVDGNCPINAVTSNNCTLFKWFAITETTYSSITLSSVTLSNTDLNTQMFTGNISATHGPLVTNVSGTCCLDIVDLHVLDTDGYLATCRLNFRKNGQMHEATTVVSVVRDLKNTTTKDDDSDDFRNVAIAVGVSAAALLVVFIIMFKVVMSHLVSSAKVKDPSITTAYKTDRVMSVKINPYESEQTPRIPKALTEKDQTF